MTTKIMKEVIEVQRRRRNAVRKKLKLGSREEKKIKKCKSRNLSCKINII